MAQYEDLIIDQGSDVEIKLELFNPDGTAKILNRYVRQRTVLFHYFLLQAKSKKVLIQQIPTHLILELQPCLQQMKKTVYS